MLSIRFALIFNTVLWIRRTHSLEAILSVSFVLLSLIFLYCEILLAHNTFILSISFIAFSSLGFPTNFVCAQFILPTVIVSSHMLLFRLLCALTINPNLPHLSPINLSTL